MTALAGLGLLMGSKQKSCCAKEKENYAAAEKAVLKTHSKIIKAAEKLDAETMFSYILDDDKGAIAQDGQLMTRTEALNQIKQTFTQVTGVKYNFQQRNIKMLSPMIALLTATGTTTSTIESGESFTSTFANTSVFVLQANEWKIIHGHHSIPNFE
jgi:hypothetical protein